MASTIMLHFVAFLFGLIVGTIVNTLSQHFIHRSAPILEDSSFPGFMNVLKPKAAIGVTNFVFKMRTCQNMTKSHTSSELTMEIICGIGSIALFRKFGFTPPFFAMALFCTALLAIFRIDFEQMIIPDAISLNGIWLGFLLSFWDAIPSMDWKSSAYGILIGGAFLYIPAYLYRMIKGSDGLGGGDIKLMAMVGAFTGAQGVIFTLFLASLFGSLAGLLSFMYKR
ncbi:MAG: prepilin peptidase, partial [Desulfomonilaceae bacterium]